MNHIQKLNLLLALFLGLLFSAAPVSSQDIDNFEISKNLDIYTTLYKELNSNYVDDINPGELMQVGIDAMLESLDPYTVYIPESKIEDYKLITTGQYGGIGALIHQHNNYVIISEPYEEFPAVKPGLKAGDKILEVNGQPAEGKSSSEVSEILKGQPGTTVSIKVERINHDKPLEFEIEREKIKIDNIPYYGMLKDDIGYIKLTGFTQLAGNDVKKALLDLKQNNELKGVILDLRGNGGGLLQEAVNVTNIFVEKGQLVVSTKGKLAHKNQDHKTRFTPVDRNIPLVVLVNRTSASASEIVSGAIQDLDRGVVVGQKTFGKGLVQNVIPLTYNAQAKITVAKYYIPSGRCIQAIDYSHKDGNGDYNKIPDSLINEFKTRNNRIVYDGGGIDPDIKLKAETYSNIASALFSRFLIFDYATKFAAEHPEIEAPDKFEISDEIFEDFVGFISERDFHYITESEQQLEELEAAAKEEKYYNAIKDEFDCMKEALIENKQEDVYTFKDEICEILKMEIITRYYYQRGKIIATLNEDPEILKSIEILEDKDFYNSILTGTYKAEGDQKDKKVEG